MAKQVIVSDGERKIFATLAEAAAWFGVTPSGLSRAIYEKGMVKGVRVRYAQRVFAVKVRSDGRWVIAQMNIRNTHYVPLNPGEPQVKLRDAEDVKELTASWYFVARDL